ncbi:MAG: hypothetical protein QOH96_930, partial [Blastocatellia bacterium]|nr:hypothetical protein [Blastocatellia bacterium]
MKLSAHMAIISVLLLCSAGFCLRINSQTRSSDKNNEATVSGKVTIKGEPAPGIVVGLRLNPGPTTTFAFKATTDQDGNYRIGKLPAGSYMVIPVERAFVNLDPNNPRGQSVVIAENENVEGIDFDLTRGGVITGRATYADGQPVIEEQVNLWPLDQRDNRGPRYSEMFRFQTDDRGVFRMFGVQPGHYKVYIG